MESQSGSSDLADDDWLSDEAAPGISTYDDDDDDDDDELEVRDITTKTYSDGGKSSFGEKTIRHFLQEYNIGTMLNIGAFARQRGYNDAERLIGLIETLIRDKRRQFTLGKGKKATRFLLWKQPASFVPLSNVSLFQLVCAMKDPWLVEKYLRQGVDVNLPIDATYRGEFAGRSPLHLALSHLSLGNSHDRLLTAYLLLNNGAKIDARDSRGNTPLHALFSGAPFNKQLFDIVMESGADDKAINDRGETPFELLIATNASLDIENYMRLGGTINHFNSMNREGCMTEIVRRISAERIGSALSLMEIDEHGRTAIHNVVSFPTSRTRDAVTNELYYDDVQKIIECVVRRGGNIDCQDESGRTPLHYAASFLNSQSVLLLLRLGANVNVTDVAGKSALASSLDLLSKSADTSTLNDDIIKIFMLHLGKLQHSGLQVSPENEANLDGALEKHERDAKGEQEFLEELERSRDTTMGTSTLKLHDFMSETGIISSYPFMLANDRCAIDQFFGHFHRKTFSGLGGMLVAQYQKAQARSSLVRPAAAALRVLSTSRLSDACSNRIIKYLTNEDLNNLIAAAALPDGSCCPEPAAVDISTCKP